MEEKNHTPQTDVKKEKSTSNLKPLKELKSLDSADGLVCDMETGICGPQKQEKEPKK